MSPVVLLGCTFASASLGPGSGAQVVPAAAAQLALPTQTTVPLMTGLLPIEVPVLPPCDPALPLQQCASTGTTTAAAPSTPCTSVGCIPQPGAITTPPNSPGTGQFDQGEESADDCGITDVGACVTEAINAFFRGIVTEALNPLLDLLSTTLLTTPMPDSLPRVGELWNNSWQILLLSYGLLVLIAGVVAMGYQSVQTRHSIKELAPRLVVGFLAGALSLWVSTEGVRLANALVVAVMDGGVEANSAGETLRNLVLGSVNGGIWIAFLGIVLAGMLVALLITYVVRVALTIILIAGAPLALMSHALPQTEGIAYWWWKAYGGCLVIQLGQSLTLITAMKVFLAPGGFTLFGPTPSGLVNLLIALALIYILFKIPFWVLSSVRGGGGRSLIGSLVRGFLIYKTFGLLGGHRSGSKSHSSSGGNGGKGTSGGGGRSDPYVNPRTTANGQYVLPLPGVRRTRPAGRPTPKPKPAPGARSTGSQGRQLALPLGEDWPENRPVLGRDGQYRLPLNVQRTTAPPAAPTGTGTSGHRVRAGGGKQLELPLAPYKGNRPTRSGQYPLPLDGVHRVSPPKAAPAPPPATPPRPAPRTGQQLRLPLDLPKPSTPPTTPVFSAPPPRARRSPKPGGRT